MYYKHVLLALLLCLLHPIVAQNQKSFVVEFSKNDHALSEEASRKLIQFIDEIHSLDLTKISITGHTDCDGTNEHNDLLSQRRAETVRVFL